MQSSLIICTYHRPESLLRLLHSVAQQTVVPEQVIVVDGSWDNSTQRLSLSDKFANLEYFRVTEKDRGLTRQRNYGVQKVSETTEVVYFLDDDTILDPNYFSEILKTYEKYPEAVGVSGYITNEVDWREVGENYTLGNGEFVYDGWVRTEGSRFSLRRKFQLAPTAPPGFMPDFSHGHSVGFLPPTGKTYPVEFFVGCSMSFKKELFDSISFSKYFNGYGLYEDMDFCLRASQHGGLYLNTASKLEHHHAPEGRPDSYKYGLMVIRNGWYVWRVKYLKPTIKMKMKWLATSGLLTIVRFGNGITNPKQREARKEGFGRLVGLVSLMFDSPKRKD